MVTIEDELLASGGNRFPSVADCDLDTGLVAYGSGNNIAVWNPQDPKKQGITHLLTVHSDDVRCIRFLRSSHLGLFLIAGSGDKSISVWRVVPKSGHLGPLFSIQLAARLKIHDGAVNALSVSSHNSLIASGSSDGLVLLWNLTEIGDDKFKAHVVQTLSLSHLRMVPLTIAHTALPNTEEIILAVAGTHQKIAIFTSDSTSGSPTFSQSAVLSGHESWVQSLDFTRETESQNADLILASASQDKYLRLWRVHQGDGLPALGAANPALGDISARLSNKPYRFEVKEHKFSITFEALLVGHEDWVFTARWGKLSDGNNIQLLSASADNSLAVWERDEATGIWICVSRLGEIAVQKGATTATGSAGGFWSGIWMSIGKDVGCLGATGNWRVWRWDTTNGDYQQAPTFGGHTRAVRGICWSKNGSYLLSTSLDQTTRLWAEWKRDDGRSWHEFARPQIHGYDLNCIDSVSETRFISGADEKLLRVFDEPVTLADYLYRLSGISRPKDELLASGASIPVLGLSNKAVREAEDPGESEDTGSSCSSLFSAITHPPLEDHLSRQTLWPEHEKLYGHGYEISAVAASHDGLVVATACKAATVDHAVLRLYDAKTWYEIQPPLACHSHTVLSLAFSPDDEYLLSAGRDRQWALWKRKSEDGKPSLEYAFHQKEAAAHSRMILDVAWFPLSSQPSPIPCFATAGRDKKINVWGQFSGETKVLGSFSTSAPVTALAVLPKIVQSPSGTDSMFLTYGLETGYVGALYVVRRQSSGVIEGASFTDSNALELIADNSFQLRHTPSASVSRLAWRPSSLLEDESRAGEWLAVASEDRGVRIYHVEF